MAMSQPPHRRPSWARTELVYKAHMRSDSVHSHSSVHSNSIDYGLDNFSYDPDHTFRWTLPEEILEQHGDAFPEELLTWVKDWALAGAAVNAAMDRIKVLRKEGLHRGWPDSRLWDSWQKPVADTPASAGTAQTPASASAAQTPASAGAAQSPASLLSPISSPMMLPVRAMPGASLPALTPPSSVISSSMCSVTGIAAPRPTAASRMVDSPPVSPLDSPIPANTPALMQAREAAAAMMATPAPIDSPQPAQTTAANLAKLTSDLAKLNTNVDTKTDTQSNSGTSTPGFKFCPVAWETYMNSFEAELDELNRHAVPRWTGFGKRINVLCYEYALEEKHKAAIEAFRPWWQSMEKAMDAYLAQIELVDMPELEDYKEFRMRAGVTV